MYIIKNCYTTIILSLYALYASAKAVIKIYKPLLDKLGITYTQYITLLVLLEQDNITVKELGKKLYLDSGTLTPLLKRRTKRLCKVNRKRYKNERLKP